MSLKENLDDAVKDFWNSSLIPKRVFEDDHDCHLDKNGEGHCDHPIHELVNEANRLTQPND